MGGYKNLGLKEKTIIYLVLLTALIAYVLYFAQQADSMIFLLASLVIHLWFMYVVYNHARSIKVSENWWLVIFLLGPLGAIIYYLSKGNVKKKTVELSS